MAQRFYNKTSVQVAIVTAIGLIVVALISISNQRSELKTSNDEMQKEIISKTATIQRGCRKPPRARGFRKSGVHIYSTIDYYCCWMILPPLKFSIFQGSEVFLQTR